MKEQMEALRQRFESELQAAQNSEAVEKLRVAYLGKKGSVTELLKGLKSVAGDQKKEMGQLINQLKRQVEEEAYCVDILMQVSAIQAALNAFSRQLLGSHIKTCVADGIRQGDDEVVDELVNMLQKLLK